MCELLYEVDASEDVARVIFSPSMVIDDRVASTAFELTVLQSGKEEDYLSVWRTLYRVPTRDNTKKLRARKPEDKVFGYAKLGVRTVHSQDFDDCTARVKRKSKDEKAYHVGIYYTVGTTQIKGEHKPMKLLLLLSKLACHAYTYPFPPMCDE